MRSPLERYTIEAKTNISVAAPICPAPCMSQALFLREVDM
jgi:hypothetical protein